MIIPTLENLRKQIATIDPEKYARSRNYLDGHVTRLSPYISRGVISTREVYKLVSSNGFTYNQCEKFFQELAWREYWQSMGIHFGQQINDDLSKPQVYDSKGLPHAVLHADTGIKSIDNSINTLLETGYMHNHWRMYLAMLIVNVGKYHWHTPSKWLYYHLFDADWASNTLSWQWVAGTFSTKKYYANQENINKYSGFEQLNTFLDHSYDYLQNNTPPKELTKSVDVALKTSLPDAPTLLSFDHTLPFFIYNYYNLDPKWHAEEKGNRVLLLEPSHFKNYPISNANLNFMLQLSQYIPNIQLYVGEWNEFITQYSPTEIYYKQHPLFMHYTGKGETYDRLFQNMNYESSFFKFWNKNKKDLLY